MNSDWVGVSAACAAGLGAGWVAWVVLQPVFGSPVLARRNFRDRELAVGGGLALVVAVIGVAAVASAAQVGRSGRGLARAESALLVVVLGFGLLGFVDDVVGSGRDRGFRGHLRELSRGRLTAGGLKLFGGGCVAILAVHYAGSASLGALLRDAALIALCANLANLFDLAPGRAIKTAAIAGLMLVVATRADVLLRGVAVVVGSALGLLWPDLRERLMLGDTGANPLGAAVGLGIVLVCAPSTRLIVLAALALLNLASEFVSFSRVIAAVPPLRWFDGVGRLR
ncbi:MAG TPA: hypothetical protein VMY88_10985 [Acidimicrobiales bacterium]|nr:hypothetical protein [Acidimicrobiales bacterium]